MRTRKLQCGRCGKRFTNKRAMTNHQIDITLNRFDDCTERIIKMLSRAKASERLEYLRGEIRAERISYGELAELQSLVQDINADDVELLEAAGIEEVQQ